MAAAYTGTTFMPTIFGLLQQQFGIWIMPYYLMVFAVLNIGLLELTYQKLRNQVR
jgi:fucose permease